VFLVVFALQLILNAFHESTEANLLPIDNAYWHLATEPYGPEGPYGALITYGLVLVPAVWLMFRRAAVTPVSNASRARSRANRVDASRLEPPNTTFLEGSPASRHRCQPSQPPISNPT
jgi:hypothetical protein